jgi:hypothetical protein
MGSERGGGRWATSGMAAAGRRAEQEAAGHAIDGTCSWEEDLVAEKIQLNYGGDALFRREWQNSVVFVPKLRDEQGQEYESAICINVIVLCLYQCTTSSR